MRPQKTARKGHSQTLPARSSLRARLTGRTLAINDTPGTGCVLTVGLPAHEARRPPPLGRCLGEPGVTTQADSRSDAPSSLQQ
jgi:hypothetical protein